MFDIGWSELFLITVVAILVLGPEEIPAVMRNIGRVMRRVQYIRFALSQQFDEVLKEHDIEELRKGVNFETMRRELKNAPPTDFDEAAADEDGSVIPIKKEKKTSDGTSG